MFQSEGKAEGSSEGIGGSSPKNNYNNFWLMYIYMYTQDIV